MPGRLEPWIGFRPGAGKTAALGRFTLGSPAPAASLLLCTHPLHLCSDHGRGAKPQWGLTWFYQQHWELLFSSPLPSAAQPEAPIPPALLHGQKPSTQNKPWVAYGKRIYVLLAEKSGLAVPHASPWLPAALFPVCVSQLARGERGRCSLAGSCAHTAQLAGTARQERHQRSE